MKPVIVLVGLIALSVAVIVISNLSFDPTSGLPVFERFLSPGPGRPVPVGPGEPTRVFFGRVGPFGRYLGGVRGVASAFAAYMFLYIASAAALFLLPRPLRVVRDALRRGPAEWARFLGIGVLCGLAFGLLTLLGVFTVVGFPIPLLLVPLLLLVAWGGLVALALALGKSLTRAASLADASPLVDLAIGSLVVFSLGQVPFIGWGITALLAALALGAVVATHFGAEGAWSLAAFHETE